MSLHLSDLGELSQSIRNLYSKSYIEEAIVAYRAGAYRATIISTWIAVCVDVIEKIRELSLGDDGVARGIEQRLDNIQPDDVNGMLSFERDILKIACDELELISPIEKTHLERLRSDRNICAHPTLSDDGTQFQPSPELARVYIVQATNYLLSKAPIKGKAIVNQLYHLVNEESFPETDERAFVMLSSEKYLGKGRVKESSVRNFTIILLKRLFKDKDGLEPTLINRICAALGAVSRLYSSIYNDVLKSKLGQMLAEANDRLLKRIFLFLDKRSEAWRYIDNPLLVRLEELILLLSTEEMINYRLVNLASSKSTIGNALMKRIQKLKKEDINKLLKKSPSKLSRKKAIEVFTQSKSFASAYSNGIDYLAPHASYLVDEDLKVLFEGIISNSEWNINQIINAGGMDEIFCLTYQQTKENVIEHAKLWKNFWDTVLAKKRYSYDELETILINDGLIEDDQSVKETEEQDPLPF